MRPEILFPLFKDVTVLPGVGKRTAALIEKITDPHLVDLCWHLPASLIDRRYRPHIADARDGDIATLEVHVDDHFKAPRKGLPYKVRCSDHTGYLTLVFFHPHVDYLQKTLPIGEDVIISGRVDHYQGEIQIAHPDHMVLAKDADRLPLVEPVYPLTQGLSNKVLSHAIEGALESVVPLAEWLDDAHVAREKWPAWHEAVNAAHHPESENDLEPHHPARTRLAYDELLANQLALALMRRHMRKQKGRVFEGDGTLTDKLLSLLPYTLTAAQTRSIDEIVADMAQPERMMRLLQGDVGSGKTVVALMAMLRVIESGSQAAIMAPTEILAHQHYNYIAPLCGQLGIQCARLTGRDKGKIREEVLTNLADGTTKIVVGTHALFQEGVTFHDLGLAVIDEQHRFGVHQRLALSGKSGATDVLVMTATPIPRTLTLTAYGDMDVSRLDEKPPGRKPVTTRAMPLERLGDVVEGLRRALKDGDQIYWVCPLVEESDVMALTSAEERSKHLREIFGDQVAHVHGRMSPNEKDKVMQDFQAGAIRILVATTVIEVGVDVPQANIMVIEHAERFGLSQLHQLRGRVGRGDDHASCLLLYQSPLNDVALARINIMRETDDGFRIAEEDLRLRGAGDVLGTRQSGLPVFRLADLEKHAALLQTARDDAVLILNKDPDLESPRGQALRTLLYLFERDEAVQFLRAG